MDHYLATIQTILDRCDDNNTSLSIDDIEVIKTNLCRIIKRAKSICHNHYNNINLLNMDTKDRIKEDNQMIDIDICPLKSKGGTVIEKGEICTIVKSYKGYSIRTDDYRTITRVDKCCVEFMKE